MVYELSEPKRTEDVYHPQDCTGDVGVVRGLWGLKREREREERGNKKSARVRVGPHLEPVTITPVSRSFRIFLRFGWQGSPCKTSSWSFYLKFPPVLLRRGVGSLGWSFFRSSFWSECPSKTSPKISPKTSCQTSRQTSPRTTPPPKRKLRPKLRSAETLCQRFGVRIFRVFALVFHWWEGHSALSAFSPYQFRIADFENPKSLFGLYLTSKGYFQFSGLFEITSENALQNKGKLAIFRVIFSISSTPNMTGRKFHRTMEMIPAHPWQSKNPSASTPIKQSTKQGNARGTSEVRRGTSSIHFHCQVPWSSGHIGNGELLISKTLRVFPG